MVVQKAYRAQEGLADEDVRSEAYQTIPRRLDRDSDATTNPAPLPNSQCVSECRESFLLRFYTESLSLAERVYSPALSY